MYNEGVNSLRKWCRCPFFVTEYLLAVFTASWPFSVLCAEIGKGKLNHTWSRHRWIQWT